jgi:hypothetical protein
MSIWSPVRLCRGVTAMRKGRARLLSVPLLEDYDKVIRSPQSRKQPARLPLVQEQRKSPGDRSVFIWPLTGHG